MKLIVKLIGEFHRFPATSAGEVPLTDWLCSIQGLATKIRQRSPQKLRQHFALDFLPEQVLIDLLEEAQSGNSSKSLYQVPELQLLKPLVTLQNRDSAYLTGEPILYQYQFLNPQTQIDLLPNDPQIPGYWPADRTTQAGIYYYKWEMNNKSTPEWLIPIEYEARQYWQSMLELEKINLILQSTNLHEFYFHLPSHPQVRVVIPFEDMHPHICQAIAYLRNNQEISSSTARKLVEEYTSQYLNIQIRSFPPDVEICTSLEPSQKIVIGRGKSRRAIAQIINNAERFLLISSYIIEDESITRLICQKVASLPQGVWIITDLRDEVIDQMDIYEVDGGNSPEKYQHTAQKKSHCLQMLLNAGANVRGGPFHLKSYISERSAYLGSCNLTGKSLDFNLEAGMTFQNTATHRGLLKSFIDLWHYYSRYEILPGSMPESFLQRSLTNPKAPTPISIPCLLTPSQYRDDMKRELQQVKGEIKIYSYTLDVSAEFLPLLQTKSVCIYLNSIPRSNIGTRVITKIVKDQHAKITLLANTTAYIGGINFDFNPVSGRLVDLMYKTTDQKEIAQMYRQLSSAHV
jgi:phosphatidylserine/phosphatidylglycerophosphate/cardiolipin synthase-like enzyme